MSLRFEIDVSDILDELDRYAEAPSDRTVFELDSVLTLTFQATQEFVHVQTGSLRGSGKQESRVVGDTWIGEIVYGGVSTGPIPTVDYAVVEQERRRDGRGIHDYLTPAYQSDRMFEAVVDGTFRSTR